MLFRRRAGRTKRPSFQLDGFKDVLFVYDEPGAGSRYRSEHQAEQLRLGGKTADLVQSGELDLPAAVGHYGRVVLNRVAWTDQVAAFIDSAHASDTEVVYDTDDLIFEPGLDRYFAFLERWPEQNRRAQIERFDQQRRTIEACGKATVSTAPLAEAAARRTRDVGIIFNAVSEEMVRLADAAWSDASESRDVVTIAYFSGTRTHDKDFLEAADAVLSVLDELPEARFLAVGKLDLDHRFERLSDRVTRLPLRPWQELPRILAGVDVNLAPLERDNPVTECKSCVKYLESGLVGVPTVASARTDFVRVIEHGANGLLADDREAWHESLWKLVQSRELAREVGERARRDVLENHTTRARANEASAKMA